MTYRGGSSTTAILHAPKIYIGYWGWGSPVNDPQGTRDALEALLRDIGGTRYLNTVAQYYDAAGYFTNPRGMLVSTWDDPTTMPVGRCITPAEITQEIVRLVQHFGWDPEGIYWLATGPSRALNVGGVDCIGGYAYHASVATIYSATHAPYVDFPVQTQACGGGGPGTQCIAYHELVEAIENPRGIGWLDPSNLEGADLCYTLRYVALGNGGGQFTIADTWSNIDNRCVSSALWGTDLYYRYGSSTYVNERRNAPWGNRDATVNFGSGSVYPLISAPTMIGYQPGYQIGVALDSAGYVEIVQYFINSGNTSTFWQGAVNGAPAGVTFGPRLGLAAFDAGWGDMFAVGRNVCSGICFHWTHLYHKPLFFGSSWDDWGGPPSGSMFMSNPTAVSWAPNQLAVFVVSNGNLWELTTNNGGTTRAWTQWSSAGDLVSDPTVAIGAIPITTGNGVITSDGTAQVAVLDSNGDVKWFLSPGFVGNLGHPNGVTLDPARAPGIGSTGDLGSVSVVAVSTSGYPYQLRMRNFSVEQGWTSIGATSFVGSASVVTNVN